MRVKFKQILFLMCCMVFILLIVGCGQGGEDIEEFDDPDDLIIEEEDEVHLRIYLGSDLFQHRIGHSADSTSYNVEALIQQFVEEHLSHIEVTFFVENVPSSSSDGVNYDVLEKERLSEMMESNSPPDIIIDFTHQLPFLLENELVSHDMLEIAEMHGLDVDLFEEAFVDQLRIQQGGSLYALPLVRNVHAIRYYPEILEELDMDSPHDQMTWEEYLVWSSDVPDPFGWLSVDVRLLIAQLGQSIVNHDSNEAVMERSVWENLIPIYQSFAPRVPLTAGYRAANRHELWMISPTYEYEADNWELMSFPTFTDYPGVSPDYVSDIITLSHHTSHIEEAMQVINLLVSEEFQTELSRIGLGSPLVSSVVHEQFGAGTTEYQGKNVQAFFQHRPVSTSLLSEQELEASKVIFPYLRDIFYEGMDAETQLDLMLEELERTPFGGEN